MSLNFERYQSLKKGKDYQVDGILSGVCHAFTKLDGANGSIWLGEAGDIRAGSRGRDLMKAGEKDNAGFREHVLNHEVYAPRYRAFFDAHPNKRLVGEWLVRHTIGGYRGDAWNNFYVFDVMDYSVEDRPFTYVHYDVYRQWMEEFGIEYVPAAFTVENPTDEFIWNNIHKGDFLLDEKTELGEGLVVKNYSFINRYGNTIWKKYRNQQFMDNHKKKMGSPRLLVGETIEGKIVKKFLTKDLAVKERDRVRVENGGQWEKKLIGKWLGLTFRSLIEDHMFQIIKMAGSHPVNFRNLSGRCNLKVRELFPDDFKN